MYVSVALRKVTLVVMLGLLASPAEASLDYNVPTGSVNVFKSSCLGKRVEVKYGTRGIARTLYVTSVVVDGVELRGPEVEKVNSQLPGTVSLAYVNLNGCRLTGGGSIRFWFQLNSVQPPSWVSRFSIVKSFFVRNGRLELHINAPAD